MRHGDCWNRILFDQFSGCIFRRKGGWYRLLCAGRKFLSELCDKTLCWPRACFAKRANCSSSNVVADTFERFWIFCHAASAQHAVGNFSHPKRAFPARRALAAALVRVELVDVVEDPNHVARIIEHDYA